MAKLSKPSLTWPKPKKFILIVASVILVLFVLNFIIEIIYKNFYPYPSDFNFGVTFSPKYAQSLGLDWQETYLSLLGELEVKHLRVPTYWDEIEPVPMQYDFSAVDFMLDEAKKRDAKAILILGVRQSRWPECHIPAWAKELSLKKRQQKTLEFIGRTLERYKYHTAILAWQVENEPTVGWFGENCDRPDKDFLKSEVELTRHINGKPIIVTDSGELGSWAPAMHLSDIFGTTLYRRVYNPLLSHVSPPYRPYMYNLKSTVLRMISAPQNLKTIISELQAEPWAVDNNLGEMPIEEQIEIFSVLDFKNYTDFAKQTGFDTAYLWGVEWWYFMAKQGHPEYLEYAKTLF